MKHIRLSEKFFRIVLGNLVICVTVLALVLIMLPRREANAVSKPDPIFSGNAPDKLSLMINVYWGTEYIEPMLDIMERHNVTTTFFVGGSWAAVNTEMLKKIRARGHEIGNHGYYHKDHSKIDAAYNRKEISSAHEVVYEILGENMTLFAPPSGAYNDTVIEVAAALGYKTVMWTRDTIDWRDHDSELIYKRAVKSVKGGDLILMHPTDATAKALERIIETIENAGLTVAPVSEVLGNA